MFFKTGFENTKFAFILWPPFHIFLTHILNNLLIQAACRARRSVWPSSYPKLTFLTLSFTPFLKINYWIIKNFPNFQWCFQWIHCTQFCKTARIASFIQGIFPTLPHSLKPSSEPGYCLKIKCCSICFSQKLNVIRYVLVVKIKY